MQAQLHVDIKPLTEKLRQAKQTAAARREITIACSDLVVRAAMTYATDHKDTGRYLRALAESGNKAGIGSYPLSPVGPSALKERILRILTAQVRRWMKLVELRAREGRTGDRSYAKILKKLRRAEAELLKFEANADMGAIVFDAFSSSRMTTVRVNFTAYGGDGRIETLGDQTLVRLHNKEPHASIVESRFGIMRRAIAAMRGGPIKRLAKAEYARQLQASGFAA